MEKEIIQEIIVEKVDKDTQEVVETIIFVEGKKWKYRLKK